MQRQVESEEEEEEEAVQTKLAEDAHLQRQVEPEEEEEEETVQTKLVECARLQRQPESEEEELQAKAILNNVPPVTPELAANIQPWRSGGQPLSKATRVFFEPRFGYDFSQVRVHSGLRAAQLTRAVNARAFTLGSDVFFGRGEYSPGTARGRRLLGHELTHVVQQGGSSLESQGGPRTIQRRFRFDANCDANARSKIIGGYLLAEWATKRASEILRETPVGKLKDSFDSLFGPKGEKEDQRQQIAKNFVTLHKTLKEDYKIQCPPRSHEHCKGGEAQVKDGNVSICMDQVGTFTRAGMARLLVHENVRRAHGPLSVTNFSDTTTGECKTSAYSDATAEKKHPVPYSCFAEKVITDYLEERVKETKTLFNSLWDASALSKRSIWSGEMTIEDAKTDVSVTVALDVTLVDLDYFVEGEYWYRHPKHGEVKGKIPFGDIKFIGPAGEIEALSITFDWRENGAKGRGFWLSRGKDELDGRWGRGDSGKNGGRWTIRKKS